MTLPELRQEMNVINRLFLTTKYYFLDFKYIHSVKLEMPIVYKTFYFFLERLFHSTCVSLILELSKLFDNREKFSLEKLCNKIRNGYSKSDLSYYQSLSDFDEMCKAIDHDRISSLLQKLKLTRDEYYAHLDRTRTAFESIQMNSSELEELISIAENFINKIEFKYFGNSAAFDLNKGELGHTLFERLDEWERYREKYGLLRMK